MKTRKLVTWTALVIGLAAMVPASASAQVTGLIKKKVKEKVVPTVAAPDTAAARSAAAEGQPVYTSHVLEITPDLLDRLEKALAAEAATREENARRLGKVLPSEEYDRCSQRVLMSPEGQRLSAELIGLLDEATTYEETQRAMEEMGTRAEAFVEPECGLKPSKAENLRNELAPRVPAAAQQASGLTDIQLSILKERILPFCLAPEAVAAAAGDLRIPGETSTVFYVYSPTEVEALQPRCEGLAESLQAGG